MSFFKNQSNNSLQFNNPMYQLRKHTFLVISHMKCLGKIQDK